MPRPKVQRTPLHSSFLVSLIFVLDPPKYRYAFEELVDLSFVRSGPGFEGASTSKGGGVSAWLGMGTLSFYFPRILGPGRAGYIRGDVGAKTKRPRLTSSRVIS